MLTDAANFVAQHHAGSRCLASDRKSDFDRLVVPDSRESVSQNVALPTVPQVVIRCLLAITRHEAFSILNKLEQPEL